MDFFFLPKEVAAKAFLTVNLGVEIEAGPGRRRRELPSNQGSLQQHQYKPNDGGSRRKVEGGMKEPADQEMLLEELLQLNEESEKKNHTNSLRPKTRW